MTRRKFIKKLTGICLAIVAGVCWLGKKTTPRRFMRAARLKKYPGPVKTGPDTYNQSEWSG
jgi:hypothetical protein